MKDRRLVLAAHAAELLLAAGVRAALVPSAAFDVAALLMLSPRPFTFTHVRPIGRA